MFQGKAPLDGAFSIVRGARTRPVQEDLEEDLEEGLKAGLEEGPERPHEGGSRHARLPRRHTPQDGHRAFRSLGRT
jgi:hypothetical protein